MVLFYKPQKNWIYIYIVFGIVGGMLGSACSIIVQFELGSPGQLLEDDQLYNVVTPTPVSALEDFLNYIDYSLSPLKNKNNYKSKWNYSFNL